jgi:hypothetical protein
MTTTEMINNNLPENISVFKTVVTFHLSIRLMVKIQK